MKDKKKSQHPDENKEKSELQKLAKWHKPTLQQLRLSLDTAFGGGSNIDGLTGDQPPQ